MPFLMFFFLPIILFCSYQKNQPIINRQTLQKNLNTLPLKDPLHLPQELDLNLSTKETLALIPTYTLRQELSLFILQQLKNYRPDFGALAIVDPQTGAILSLVSYKSPLNQSSPLSLLEKPVCPAASIFKIITSTALLNKNKVTPQTPIDYWGEDHTLYKSNLLESKLYRKGKLRRRPRRSTLKEAFARSINGVFGRLGLLFLTPDDIKDYASRYFFNRQIPSDFTIPKSLINIGDLDEFQLAEISSGFTKESALGVVHGALLAAAIVNDGKMLTPYIVDTLKSKDGTTYYQAQKEEMSDIALSDTVGDMKSLMIETVRRGTARGSFRRFNKKNYIIGGKTGTLSNFNKDDKQRSIAVTHKDAEQNDTTEQALIQTLSNDEMLHGKCDWFIGFFEHNTKKIAFAILTVHKKYWNVKSSKIAALILGHLIKKGF